MKRASVSPAICLAVVPEETSEWNPLAAPQAMMMKTKGKMDGAPSGLGRKLGAAKSGCQTKIPR
jgi:hypothetical protein